MKGFHGLIVVKNTMTDRLTIIDKESDGSYLCRIHSVPDLHRIFTSTQLQECLLFPSIESADAFIAANIPTQEVVKPDEKSPDAVDIFDNIDDLTSYCPSS